MEINIENMISQELVLVNLRPELFSKKGGIKPVLEKIKEEVLSVVTDASTDEGRKQIASLAYKVARSKTTLDNMGKELADELNAKLKPINAERRLAREFLDNLKEEVRKPLTDFEDREKERIDKIKKKIEFFEFTNIHLASIELLKQGLEEIQNSEIDDSYQEFKEIAKKKKEEAIRAVKGEIALKEQEERERKEREKAEKERLEKERQEREEQIRKEEAEKARIERERAIEAEKRRAQEAQERAEREKTEALKRAEEEKQRAIEAEKEKARREAEIAERERQLQIKLEQEKARKIEAEKKAQEEAELKRIQNLNHRKKIHKEIGEGFMNLGLSKDQARLLLDNIRDGKIPHLEVKY